MKHFATCQGADGYPGLQRAHLHSSHHQPVLQQEPGGGLIGIIDRIRTFLTRYLQPTSAKLVVLM